MIKMDNGEANHVVGKILEDTKLRSLQLDMPKDARFLADHLKCDLAALKRLNLYVQKDPLDAKALAWMKTATSRLCLESMELKANDNCSLEFLELLNHTLRSVSVTRFRNSSPCQGFMQRLLSSPSQSLESISVSPELIIDSHISLPILLSIRVSGCLSGWEDLCGSLKSLKNIYFFRVSIKGTPPFVSHLKSSKHFNSTCTISLARWLGNGFRIIVLFFKSPYTQCSSHIP